MVVMSMKVMITGGAGFIGSHLTDALIQKGFDVHVVDDLSGGKKENVPAKATLHVVSICDYDALQNLFTGVDFVFHLAALPRVQYSIEHPRETSEVNVNGTLNVLLAAKEAGVKKVIYSASSSAYGDTDAMPLREDMPANPISPYALQKYIGELNCRLFSTIYGLPTVSLRYFNVYGSRQDPTGPYALVIGRFLLMKREGKPLLITGDGTQTRDFTHVRDVVHANILAMESSKVGKGEVINIGAGQNRSINEIAKNIGGAIEYIEKRIEPHDTLADISRAKELLGWAPQVPFDQGIQELLSV